jgi:hypothetical protein
MKRELARVEEELSATRAALAERDTLIQVYLSSQYIPFFTMAPIVTISPFQQMRYITKYCVD